MTAQAVPVEAWWQDDPAGRLVTPEQRLWATVLATAVREHDTEWRASPTFELFCNSIGWDADVARAAIIRSYKRRRPKRPEKRVSRCGMTKAARPIAGLA